MIIVSKRRLREMIAKEVSQHIHQETRGYGLRARLDYIDGRLASDTTWQIERRVGLLEDQARDRSAA